MSITLNPALISNINELKDIPVSITKLIVDMCFDVDQKINYNLLERIISVECKTSVNWRSAINSLRFLIKYSLKNQYPSKAIGVFLTQKTLLSQIAQYVCQKYEDARKQKPENTQYGSLQQIAWSACNLRQGRNNEHINKIYMKVYSRSLQNGSEQQKVTVCQLSELKLLLSELAQINSNIK